MSERLPQQDEAIAHAAACIAGTMPPPHWLIEIITLGVGALRGNYETRESTPTRTELRRRLAAIRSASDVLAREFKDYRRNLERYACIPWLQAAGLDQPTINALAQGLPKLATCAAAVRLPHAGQGRHKSFVNEAGLTPYEICAGLVAYGWLDTRGKPPPHTCKTAHRACEAVWQAAGLPRARAGAQDSLTGWRTHLQGIKRRISAYLSDNQTDWSMRVFWQGLEDLHPKDGKPRI
jgi:hypothetical protein